MQKLWYPANGNRLPLWCYALAVIVLGYGSISRPEGIGIIIHVAVIATLLCAGKTIQECACWKTNGMFPDDLH